MPEVSRERRMRDVRVAALLALISVGSVLVGLAAPVRLLGVESPWWHLIPALIGCAVLPWQRVWPIPVVLVGLACMVLDMVWEWSLGPFLVFWDMLYVAALTWRWKRVLLLRHASIATGALAVLVVLVLTGHVRDAANAGLVAVAVLLTPLWWGIDVRRKADLAALVERTAQQDRQAAIRDERARTARDLHDAVAGDLASIAIHAEAGLRSAATGSREQAALQQIRDGGVRALDELTRMISVLRRDGEAQDDPVTAPGLAELPDLLDRSADGGLRLTRHVDADGPVPQAVQQAAYRIVQEALTNVARHGDGQAEVAVSLQGEVLRVTVDSTGVAGDDRAGTGMGLLTMRERAEALGGSFRAGPREPEQRPGWHVEARIPLRA